VIPVSRPTAKIAAAGTLGFASALPFVFLTGTLAGWSFELGISMTMVGLMSSITFAYAFKLLQAPLFRCGLHSPLQPDWDWIERHTGCFFELVYTVSNDGFAFLVLVQAAPGVLPDLLALCRAAAPET